MIPELLKNFNNWVNWKLEERDGKLTKVPKHPITGKNAKSDDPATWTDYATALENSKYFDGNIGFMLQPQTINLVGVDIDHCLNGSLSPLATETITALNSYTEVTPSGNGIRIFALGTLPPKERKKPELDFEIYDCGRFLSVTGNHLDNTPLTIESRDAEIITLHQKIFGAQSEQPEAPPIVQPVSVGDIELLSIIIQSKQGSKFSKLWAGDSSGYKSSSEADMALADILAFWTGNDKHRIQQLMNQSGLRRDKWNEPRGNSTWIEQTIDEAITNTKEIYQPASDGIKISDIIFNAVATSPEEEKDTSWADLRNQLGPITWDWPGWIARGFQILVASVPGEGKSNLILHVARVYLSGSLWPDLATFKGEAGKILWCETESAQALNLERAEKWKIPLKNIITPLDDALSNISLDDKDHLAAIFHKAQHPDIRLVIVDSLSGGTRREARNSSDMLAVGGFLADLAKVTGKPILVSHHLNKSRNGSDLVTLDRVRDSSAIVQLARVVWAIDTPDIEKPEAKRLYCIKNNLAKFPKPLGFEIDETGLTFTDAPKPPKKEGQEERAVNILKNYLIARNNNVPAAEIEELIKIEHISQPTLYRAKSRLGIKSKKLGDVWYWSLPTDIEVI